jgi:hypothetical protein
MIEDLVPDGDDDPWLCAGTFACRDCGQKIGCPKPATVQLWHYELEPQGPSAYATLVCDDHSRRWDDVSPMDPALDRWPLWDVDDVRL